MAIAGAGAARALKAKGYTAKTINNSGASAKTKRAFKTMAAKGRNGFKKK